MGQAMEKSAIRLPAALAVALVCTGLIIEAIVSAVEARVNGDLMVDVAPILGAIFLSVPTGQAWWFVISRSIGRLPGNPYRRGR
jgi:hypothetical protein